MDRFSVNDEVSDLRVSSDEWQDDRKSRITKNKKGDSKDII